MQDASSAKPGTPAAAFDLPVRRRLVMIAMAYIPLLHVGMGIAAAAPAMTGRLPMWTLIAALVAIFVLPALIVRVALRLWPISEEKIEVGSSAFLKWWFCAQWQVLFDRLPWLEEVLRLVPGLYSAWLRLWGAKVGPLVYWSPGSRVHDRPWIVIGRRVVVGLGARLQPHTMTQNGDGRAWLLLSPVRLGDHSVLGGLAMLSPGSVVPDRAVVGVLSVVPPFATWRDGARAYRRLPLIGASTT